MTNIKASSEEWKTEGNGKVYSKGIENSNTQRQEFITQPARISGSSQYVGVHCYFSRILHIATAGQDPCEQHNIPDAISFL